MRVVVRGFAIVLACAASLQSQPAAEPHWSISAGPTMNLLTHRPRWITFACDTTCNASDVGLGTGLGMYNVAAGASRRLTGTALTLRGDLLYNWSSSARNGTTTRGFSGENVWYADREELFAATLGLQWDAMPGRPLSPYLLTSAGRSWHRTKWGADSMPAELAHARIDAGIAMATGAGVRLRAGKREYFAEWQRYLGPDNGLLQPTVAALSLGIRF